MISLVLNQNIKLTANFEHKLQNPHISSGGSELTSVCKVNLYIDQKK